VLKERISGNQSCIQPSLPRETFGVVVVVGASLPVDGAVVSRAVLSVTIDEPFTENLHNDELTW
jgi:hypothetical protein